MPSSGFVEFDVEIGVEIEVGVEVEDGGAGLVLVFFVAMFTTFTGGWLGGWVVWRSQE